MQITMEIPEVLAVALNFPDRSPADAALEAMALEAFREHKLTSFELRTVLGIPSRFELWDLLKRRQIETYTAEDLEHDMAVLAELRPAARS